MISNKLVIGILAHVDAGKTTLSEGMLYLAGKTQKLGRVDKRDAYLDTHELEKERGITIFSKQAVLDIGDKTITLLDTPGHTDFSAEMERTLQVLDYAILVISGSDGVQGHTATLWRLLEIYEVPVFIFVNKMDLPGANKAALIDELQERLSDRCLDFTGDQDESFFEHIALSDDELMDTYLETGSIAASQIRQAIRKRKVFPCFFGSALKLEGVEEFMQGIAEHTLVPKYPAEFGAKIFKISRDEQGNRLTHMKVTGGKLQVRDSLAGETWEEKVTQIRIYSGEKYEAVLEVEAGSVCAVTGLTQTRPGNGLGFERSSWSPILEPVLSYRILLPEGCDPAVMLPKLREIEEEEPELRIVWDEQLQEIQAQIMGDVQIEILQSLIAERFGVEISFDEGRILYKETIANTVEGVGHFEPLGHYAEVHLLLEPGERGSGLQFAVDCSEDHLAKNWQRLILTHLKEKMHKGVLTGSPITDMKITLVAGRAHNQHTEGGDFREATYRAVRQGLKEADSILLEPYYTFRLEVPEKMVGRAMTDIEKMQGTWEIKEAREGYTVLEGSAPVINMRNYHREVTAYTRGEGRLFLSFAGYRPCHNTDEVVASIGYDSERDLENPTGSIFCSHGAGFHVPWDQVKQYMHVEAVLQEKPALDEEFYSPAAPRISRWRYDDDDDDYRYLQTTANYGAKTSWKQKKAEREKKSRDFETKPEPKENYLLVDGYNVIHAWPELQELAEDNMDMARTRLLDALSSFRGMSNYKIIVVFDAYRVEGRPVEEISEHHNIYVVYTKEAQTADQYIEKFAFEHKKDYNITVATSDALQQVITRGAGTALLSARELREVVLSTLEQTKSSLKKRQGITRTSLDKSLSQEVKEQLKELQNGGTDNVTSS